MIREKIRPADCEQSIQRNRKRPVRLFRFYFKFIFSVSIRILIEIFVFKLNKFSTLSSQYITYSIYYGCFPGIIFTNQHIYAFLKMNF